MQGAEVADADVDGAGLVDLGEEQPVVEVGDRAEVVDEGTAQLVIPIDRLLVVLHLRSVDGQRPGGDRGRDRRRGGWRLEPNSATKRGRCVR